MEAALPPESQPGIASCAMRSDVGAVRERNEDAAYLDPKQRFFIVADGMGGHSSGDVASAMAVQSVREVLEESELELESFAVAPCEAGRERLRALLDRAIRRANIDVLERSRREPDKYGMGTTIDVVLILAGEAFIAHAGDSRTYLFREGTGLQVTMDHTVAQAMCDAGALTAEQAEQSPLRSVLSNAVGSSPQVVIDQFHLDLEPGDRLLLCSDGLYEYFELDELIHMVSDHPGDRALSGLIDEACARGGHDNITGIVVEIGEPTGVHEEAEQPVEAVKRSNTLPYGARVDPDPDPDPRGPLDEIGDDALAAFVEHALRESSQPHVLPALE